MLMPTFLAGLLLSGVGVGVQAVDTPKAGAPSTAVTMAAPPPVAPSTIAPSTVAEAKTADADTVVCKYDAQTGTRFPTRICHTKLQWDKMARDARDYINSNAGHFGCGKTTC
jgi:hypothetical protein